MVTSEAGAAISVGAGAICFTTGARAVVTSGANAMYFFDD